MVMVREGRVFTGVLSTLLLSVGTDAFSVCPVTKSAARCRRTTGFASSTLSTCSSVHASRWIWKSVGTHSSSALGMADTPETAAEVTEETIAGREFQLEELEDRDVMETSVVLGADGTVETGVTNGPLPMSCQGIWTFEEGVFIMDISRTYDAAVTPYTVRRTYNGEVDEMLPATDTLILSGDISMEDNKVGYFKMISAPSDILDSLKSIDDRIKERASN